MALTEDRFMELMEIMNEKQFKKIEEKVASQLETVKKDLTGTIDKISERQDTMDNEQKVVKKQMESMQEQMKEIKSLAQSQQAATFSDKNSVSYATMAAAVPPQSQHSQPVAPNPDFSDGLPIEESSRKAALDILDLCRRTVSLHPFSQADIDFESRRGASDVTEAKLWAVQTFFRYEMNIKSHVLASFSIENIFFPESESKDTVYVTFTSITEANTVYSYTKNMRKAVTVGIFVPNEWRARFKAVNSFAYGLRKPPTGQTRYNTRIKWGQHDLVLYRKEPGTMHWSIVSIPVPLPPVEMCAVGAPRMSPAPGRQYKRQRSLNSGAGSDSEGEDRRVRQRPNVDSELEQGEGTNVEGAGCAAHDKEAGEQLQELGDCAQQHAEKLQQDLGRVTSEESYCPASPAPFQKSKALTSSIQESPIFKKSKSSSYRINPLI